MRCYSLLDGVNHTCINMHQNSSRNWN